MTHQDKKPMEQPVLETARLRLRPFVAADAKQVQLLAGDKRVAEMTLHIPHPYLDGLADQWIAAHPGHWQNKSEVIYAITDKASLSLIGTMSLVDVQGDEAELGYWLGVDYWGQNYGTEAAQALVDFAFSSLGIKKITADHLVDNLASGRVMEKIGMTYQYKRQKLDRFARLADVKVYYLLKNDESG